MHYIVIVNTFNCLSDIRPLSTPLSHKNERATDQRIAENETKQIESQHKKLNFLCFRSFPGDRPNVHSEKLG